MGASATQLHQVLKRQMLLEEAIPKHNVRAPTLAVTGVVTTGDLPKPDTTQILALINECGRVADKRHRPLLFLAIASREREQDPNEKHGQE